MVKLLNNLTITILALVPKVETPDSVLDYRPISCCNVLYKCISKIITDRLKGSLDKLLNSSIADIIDENGQWKWPSAWYDIYPVLIGLTVPQLIQGLDDSTTWKDLDGTNRPFRSL
ncbi:uncharacterized protein LOC118488215 [Helianthus annuus]|uniref:uncharacterized protein LOC118488215 n=1 Tax=Helianthus annuus TaxID=4232 RepID=UPI001652E2B9|nr:uncharacterized protein LOC118488215 [Helianthus annuus]